jgi:hypothetical protein
MSNLSTLPVFHTPWVVAIPHAASVPHETIGRPQPRTAPSGKSEGARGQFWTTLVRCLSAWAA